MSATLAEAPSSASKLRLRAFLALATASAGVVFGDIGTSPLYAFHHSIAHLRRANGTIAAADVKITGLATRLRPKAPNIGR